jgi:hypothetical protein
MTFDDRDDVFDARLRELARDYHKPPEPPRDEMWAVISARRATPRVRVFRGPWTWGLAAAATLAVGVALGRWSAVRAAGSGPPAVAEVPLAPDAPLRLAATQYLTRAEALLTGVRSGSVPVDAPFLASARELLTMTRLLLDSPLAQDPQLLDLLEDLELVLAQVVRLEPAPREADDLDLITDGLNQRGVLPRLRAAIPAGPAAVGARGDL